jgi:hypothetical protein
MHRSSRTTDLIGCSQAIHSLITRPATCPPGHGRTNAIGGGGEKLTASLQNLVLYRVHRVPSFEINVSDGRAFAHLIFHF